MLVTGIRDSCMFVAYICSWLVLEIHVGDSCNVFDWYSWLIYAWDSYMFVTHTEDRLTTLEIYVGDSYNVCDWYSGLIYVRDSHVFVTRIGHKKTTDSISICWWLLYCLRLFVTHICSWLLFVRDACRITPPDTQHESAVFGFLFG